MRDVTVRVQSESARVLDLCCLRKKKNSIRCQISRSKTRYILFQHKWLFNLVKNLLKWFEGLGRSVTVQVQSEKERVLDLVWMRKKALDTLSNLALKNLPYSVSTEIASQPKQDLLRKLRTKGGLSLPDCSLRGKNFWPRWYTKKLLDTLSDFALKNSLYDVSTWIAF